jgi:hypothetical protein
MKGGERNAKTDYVYYVACIMFAGTPLRRLLFRPRGMRKCVGRSLSSKPLPFPQMTVLIHWLRKLYAGGYSYSFITIVKEEKPFEIKSSQRYGKVETKSKDLSAILNALEPAIQYDTGSTAAA